uniref:RING-type E3 ubiquitin transferase n=1 Tax=Aegilops tauschii TaxID=37682 RepID=M8B0M5_AEGTA
MPNQLPQYDKQPFPALILFWTNANTATAVGSKNVVEDYTHERTVGGELLYKFADEKEKQMHRDKQTEATVRMLLQYKSLCDTREVKAHYITHDDILVGLVNLIKKLKIKRIVIGSSNYLMDEIIPKCSNDYLKHTGSIGYRGSSDLLASIHELTQLSDESDGYTTPPSDFSFGPNSWCILKYVSFQADDIINGDRVIQMDGADQSAKEAEQGVEESNAYEEVEIFSEEGADKSDEIQSARNISEEAAKLMDEMEKLQRKLKDLQDEGYNHEQSILSPRKGNVLLRERTLSKKRYPKLHIPDHISEFPMSRIEKATNNFHSKNLIGEGGYGPVYKGKLGGVIVAIKMLGPHGKPHGKQGFPEFQQEVAVLSRTEHPHIVRLIGVCQESCILIYEHLPNGTLMDGLSKGLPWKDRIRILAEQRSALAHLHSSFPHAIIHADLKLTNILLDAGNVSRLGDFGTARIVQMKPLKEDTICRRTNPMGTMGYMDPIFFMTGELTTESDVYAFGMVILQVLTGLLDLNIVEQVREALRRDAVHGLLDASAGSWPEVQAERLLRLALKCCNLERKQRPTFTSDTDWRPLDILRTMATASKSRKWSRGK